MRIQVNVSVALLGLFLASVWATDAAAAEVSLRTMSFNVRYAGTLEGVFGPNGWYVLGNPEAGRVSRAIQVVRDYGPDILGTQELLDMQLKDFSGETMAAGLSDYGYYGIGRDDGAAAGEYAAIFYRANRFTQLDAGTFWLSQTPDVPGSQYPGAGSIRIASWVLLDDHASGQQIFVLNTHFDNSSSAARTHGANLIRDRLPALAGDAPILLTGDFNTTASSSVVQTLMGQNDPQDVQLGDSYRNVHPVVASNERTFHDFSGGASGSRIDFILHSAELVPTAASIVRTTYDGKYPSDHYPVTADFTLAVVPEPSSIVLCIAAGGSWWFVCRHASRRRRK